VRREGRGVVVVVGLGGGGGVLMGVRRGSKSQFRNQNFLKFLDLT
jgi:hypothetical protein